MEPHAKTPNQLPWAIWLVGVAAAVIVLSKGVTWVFPPPEVPLLPAAPGRQTLTLETAPDLLGRPLPAPTFTAGAELFTAARFPQDSSAFPAGTLELVYAKDGRRLFEVIELPLTNAADTAKYAPGVPGTDVVLGSYKGRIMDPGLRYPACLDANDQRPLDVCQFTKRFVFATETRTYVVAVDGTGLSDGELIQIARSISMPVLTTTD